MTVLVGLDVGTTGAKAVLIDPGGRVRATVTTEYPLLTPRAGWTEQDPADWWMGSVASIRGVLDQAAMRGTDVAAIGLTGQMHGLVALDGSGGVLRPAILWNDQRTAEESAWITGHVGAERVIELTANPILTGFTAPKIIWMRRHESERYARLRHILLPKDYIRYKLTGEMATDVADASGTALFDVRNRAWSTEMLSRLDIPSSWLPLVAESIEEMGTVTKEAGEATGLRPGTLVVAGAGDQAAQAVGTGVVEPGLVSATIGTSGVVFAHTDQPEVDALGRLHTFCHAVPGRWHVMGVMLSAGGSLRWLRDILRGDSYSQMTAEAAAAPPGAEGLVFLPYLTGERTPHADPHARGAFVGLTIRHGRGHLIRAVMEGVAFGLRDALEIIRGRGIPVTQVRVSGGGARSGLWRQILADTFAVDVVTVSATEGAAYGAALLAGVGAGIYPSVESACHATISTTEHVSSDPDRAAAYDPFYRLYTDLFVSLKPSMHALGGLAEVGQRIGGVQ